MKQASLTRNRLTLNSSILILPAIVGLLAWPEVLADGIRRGLECCGGILIPSLFPFMTLCCFLNRSGAARVLSAPLAPLTVKVYKLPREAGATVLLSLLAGYPAGAKMISGLLSQGRIDQPTAERMLYFCVCASPSFLISAVGAGILGDARIGAALFFSHALAALLLGALVSLRASKPRVTQYKPQASGAGGDFVAAVSDASSAMLLMCAMTLLFSGIAALVIHLGLPDMIARVFSIDYELTQTVAMGFLEVTRGCLAASELGGELAILLISAFCSFGGLSVIFQVLSCFENRRPRLWPILLGRLAHTLLALGFMLPLYRRFFADTAVMLQTTPPIPHTDGKTWVITICLIAMAILVVRN